MLSNQKKIENQCNYSKTKNKTPNSTISEAKAAQPNRALQPNNSTESLKIEQFKGKKNDTQQQQKRTPKKLIFLFSPSDTGPCQVKIDMRPNVIVNPPLVKIPKSIIPLRYPQYIIVAAVGPPAHVT